MTDTDQHLGELGVTEDQATHLLAGAAENRSAAAQDTQEPSSDPGEGQESDDAPGGAEAAKWRRRLRDVETERDQLLGQVTALQRAEVERLAGEHMSTPADLWVVGTELNSMLADDGAVDPAKVIETARDLVVQRPSWGHSRLPIPGKPKEKLRGGGDPSALGRTTSWSDVLGRR